MRKTSLSVLYTGGTFDFGAGMKGEFSFPQAIGAVEE
jgi:hypothetical protein